MASSVEKLMTLEDIERRKEEIRIELDESKCFIVSTTKSLFGPPPAPANSTEVFMRNLNTGIMVFNGFKTGMKMVRMLKGFFRKHHK